MRQLQEEIAGHESNTRSRTREQPSFLAIRPPAPSIPRTILRRLRLDKAPTPSSEQPHKATTNRNLGAATIPQPRIIIEVDVAEHIQINSITQTPSRCPNEPTSPMISSGK